MSEMPQELRILKMEVTFLSNTSENNNDIPMLNIKGMIITISGKVCHFTFERGKITIIPNDKQITRCLFSKTIQQQLEILLSSYICGALKINTIQCRFEDECYNTVIKTAEIEE